jgi:protein involved in polysaccharide export with SLBB domain
MSCENNLYLKILLVFIIYFIYNGCLYANDNKILQSNTQTNKLPFKPGDAIQIYTFPDTTSFLHRKIFSIDYQGLVNLPIVQKINVSKMTSEEFTLFLKDTYKSYIRSSNITVDPMIRISLLGGFVRSGLYYVDINNSLWDVIRQSGGPLMEDGIYNMKWERNGDELKDDLTKYFESGISLKQMGFQSGDQISTPRPDTETFWDTINNFMPLITLATTISLIYITYQQSLIQIQYLR